MWVNPFWFGVIVTIIVEIVACIIYAVSTVNKRGEN